MSAPYAGGSFQGHHLAGVEIGSLNGQGELALQPIDLALTPPPPGDWKIVLMLREWTAAGFVTRDFTNFTTRFVSEPVAEKTPAPVVRKLSVPAAEALSLAVVRKPAEPVAAKAPAPEVVKAAAPAAPAKAPSDGSANRVSVNTARIEELAAVKGLSRKQAEGIVKIRPFASLDDLRRIKGIGASVLAKIRSSLKL